MKPNVDKLLNKAKFGLITKGSVFLSTIAFSMKYRWDPTISTANVNGITININPDFFIDASEEQRIFVLAHESWHVALNHITRRGERDKKIWNEAGDYVINLMLDKAGYQMWPWVLLDHAFYNMSTDQVYDLIKDRPRQPNANGFGNDIVEPGAEPEKMDSVIKGILAKAITQSKMHGKDFGSIPDEITKELDDIINPVLPWELLLDRFLTDKVKDDYSWARPNRRFMPDYYLPSQYSDTLGHITIAVDTSGSITQDDMTKILSEIVHIKGKFNPKKLTIIDCDCRINHVHDVTETTNILDLRFTGGGGTSFEPVIDYCRENPPMALLYFTDLEARQITEEQPYPILWLCYSNRSPAPVGDTIYYKS